jgi:nucleotide-binding universal stress UspA family protein
MTHIVVGYDGTPGSEPALATALHEAARTGAELRVVMTWRTTPYVGSVPGYGYDVLPPLENMRGELGAVVEDAVARARAETGRTAVPVSIDVGPGDAAAQLVDASTTADLLVLGTRRHNAVVSALVGSATNYVLHHAQCPVLVVGPGAEATWERVVVGIDGSSCSRSALRWAATRAEQAGCPLLVVHAWELMTSPDWYGTPLPDPPLYDKQVQSWMHDEVDEVLGATDVPVEIRSVHESAAHGLLQCTVPADLLVLGSRGRNRVTDLLLGSVTMTCVHPAQCSVAVLRSGTGPTP